MMGIDCSLSYKEFTEYICGQHLVYQPTNMNKTILTNNIQGN